VRRTRKALREALYGLIVEKGYESLSVGEITRRAMVNRATFYRHFRDKPDLARACVADTCAELLAGAQPPAASVQIEVDLRRPPANFLLLFRHIRDNRELYRAVLAAERVPVFEEQVREVIRGMVRGRLRTLRRSSRDLPVPVELTEEFLAGAYLGVIRWWLEAGLPHDAERMALWLSRLALLGPAAALGLRVQRAGPG
jgi:AcrR family transcriptional regulator